MTGGLGRLEGVRSSDSPRARGARAGGGEALLEHVLERQAQVLDRAAVLGGGGERAVESVDERAGQIAAPPRERFEWAPDPAGGRRGRGAAHRVDAAERLVEDQRQRVEIGLLADRLPLGLLGRHVGEGAEHVAGTCQGVLADQAGAAEIGELGRLAALADTVGYEHVLGLDVAVDHTPGVGMGESARERQADLEHLLVGELAGCDQPRQGAPLDQLGDQVEGLLDHTCLIQGDDRRVR